ncbi:MAG: nuclear transport factor 2 family protein [Myxococcota bacterium]
MTEPTFSVRHRVDEIERVLTNYLDALYEVDVVKLATALHPRAIYATADGNELLFRTMEEYFPVVAERVSPASRGEAREDAIDSVEFAGENTAFARVRCAFSGKRYVDFLTLIRDEGRWQIIAKIFHYEEVPCPT